MIPVSGPTPNWTRRKPRASGDDPTAFDNMKTGIK